MITISKAEYDEMKQQIAWLMEQLKLSKHHQFGTSSEKSEYNQIGLFNEAESTVESSVPESELEEVKMYRRKKSRASADRLPPDLPVEVIHYPKKIKWVPTAGGYLPVMGHEIRED